MTVAIINYSLVLKVAGTTYKIGAFWPREILFTMHTV